VQIADMMAPDGKVFLKSEWAPISDYWPCVSFTKRSVGYRLSKEFVPGRDVLVYVGTTNADLTEDPDHRSRLLSAVVVEPNQLLETRKLIPAEHWARSVEAHGDRWPHSLAVTRAASMLGPPYPNARTVIPQAYRSFASIQNRGDVVLAEGAERAAVMAEPVTELHLNLTVDVQAYLKLRASVSIHVPLSVKQEVSRMVALIQDRVSKGGEIGVKRNPLRFAPNHSDLSALLTTKWQDEQRGLCALCGGALVAGTTNAMMKPSPDRIDGTNGAYSDDNVQITHLACNLAKNQYGVEQFEEWIAALRGVDISVDAT
jgi:hypothetical protein